MVGVIEKKLGIKRQTNSNMDKGPDRDIELEINQERYQGMSQGMSQGQQGSAESEIF